LNPIDEFRIKVEHDLGKKKGLTTIVEILRKVQRLASSDNSSIHEIAAIVASDAVLTSSVLRMVNSAFFGVEHKISSIEEAVVLLGFSHLRDLFAGMMMSSATQGAGHDDFDRTMLWRHSVGTAVAADNIKSFLGLHHARSDLHMAGLLCNIGRLVLDQRFPEEFKKAIILARGKKIRLIEAELVVFGVTHAEVGFWVAEFWNFDHSIANLIRWHHGPAESREVDVINLAYVITQARLIGNPGDHILTRLLPGLFKRLELNEQKLNEILVRLTDSYESLNWIFKYVPGETGAI
jgi:HD-like signal output (HDOD) protein